MVVYNDETVNIFFITPNTFFKEFGADSAWSNRMRMVSLEIIFYVVEVVFDGAR